MSDNILLTHIRDTRYLIFLLFRIIKVVASKLEAHCHRVNVLTSNITFLIFAV